MSLRGMKQTVNFVVYNLRSQVRQQEEEITNLRLAIEAHTHLLKRLREGGQ